MKRLLTILFFFTAVFCSAQTHIYYFDAVNGDDARTSAQAQVQTTAWKTITKLNSFFTSLVAGDQVLFRRGQTFPGGIVVAKSGTAAQLISFGAWDVGANPIISGLTPVTAWTSLGGNQWQSTNAVSTLTTLNMVLINGVFAPIGVWGSPVNNGYFNPTPNTNNVINSNTGGTGSPLTLTSAFLTGAPNFVGGEVISRKQHWVVDRGTISAQGANTLTFTNPTGLALQNTWGFFVQNHRNACDVLNEWWYDGTAKKIGIFNTVTPTNVEVATVDNLVNLQSFSFLSFNSIQFRGSNGHCVTMNSANNHVTFSGCSFNFCGINGINATPASNNFTITNNSFERVNNNGIEGASSTNWTITGNNFHNSGAVWGMGQGGAASYEGMANIGSNSTITNNVVKVSGYNGIEFRGSNITIRNNYVDTANFRKDDGGGIYTQIGAPTVRTNQIVDANIVLNCGGTSGTPLSAGPGTTTANSDGFGIYLDDNSNGISVTNNTIGYCGSGGLFLHGDSGLVITGNTIYNCNLTGSLGAFNVITPGSTTSTINMRGVRSNNNIVVQKSASVGATPFFVANFQTNNEANMVQWSPNSASWDNNFYCRPFQENAATIRRQTTPGGATNSNLAGWQAFTAGAGRAFDVNSKISPKTIPDTTSNNIRFYYNTTTTPVAFSIPGTWEDMRSTNYNGSITVPAFSSAVIIFVSAGGGPLSATATVGLNPVACFGNVTTVTLNASGGTAPYQYRLTTGVFGTQNVFTGLGAGTYTFQVRDAALTVFPLTVVITQPSQINITQSSTPITINGQSSTTTVSAGGGTPGYRYKLDAGIFQPSNVFTGVLAGPHTITVIDANNCTNTLAYTLTQPTALVISASATTLLCFNSTGTITVTASGATPPYQYSINGGAFQNPNTFTNRAAGTYTLTVKDAAGATQTTTITLTAPSALTLTESHTPILVNGNTSTVTLTGGGGTPPYTYSLNGVTFQSSNVFNNVAAGTYTATIKDANGCTNTLTFTINQPSSLSGSAVVGTISCFGGTAPLTITATGGTPAYQYSINGGATFQSSNVFTVAAGTYNVTIRDAGGALFTFNQALTQPTAITISESHTPILVNGNTSTVTLSASGATSPYTYSIDGVTFQSSPVFNNVAAGSYIATVKDANNCTNTLAFTITQPSSLTLSAAVSSSIVCSGGVGSAFMTASGGTAPYQYKVGTGAFQSSPTFSNLVAGTYLFTVQDGGGAISTTNLTITQPPPIAISLAFSDAPTNVVVTPSGGVAPFMYRLDGGSLQSSNTFTNVPAGNHTSIVVDANGCIGQRAFTVNNLVFIGVSFPPILCNGGSTPVTITASGGVPPYFISGGSPQTKTAGDYTFTVTDSRGAIAQFTTTITEPAPMTISESHTPILINGNTSTVTFTVGGGTGSKTYSLDGVTFQGSNVFNNVPAGNYTVTVKDANNCTNVFSFTITQPGALSVIATPGTIACSGGTTTVTLTGSGGTTPYHYRMNSGALQLSNVFLLVPAGTNTFTVQDNFGAVAQVITTINQPLALTLSVVTGTILVNGGNTSLTATGGGGTGSLQYSLDGGAYQGSGTFTGVLAGQHTVTVKDANNCTNFNTFTIDQPGVLGLSVALGTITCNGGAATASTITGSGGTTPYTYSVDGGAYSGSNSFTGLLAGSHTFSIKDAFGSIAQSIRSITQPTAIILSVTTGTITVNGGVTNVNASASGGGGGIQYSLDGGAYQVSGTFTGVSAGPHTVTAKDVSNCTTLNTFSISQPGALHATVTFGQNPMLCYGITTPMTITPFGGTPPYTITGGSPQIVAAGTYTVHVTDAFNIPFDTIVTVTQPPLTVLVQVLQYPNPILLFGGTADSVWVSSGGGTPISGLFYNYALDGGSFTLSDSAFKFKFTNVTGGAHTVTIRDGHGCAETYPFFVTQPPPPLQKQTHSWDRRRVYKNN